MQNWVYRVLILSENVNAMDEEGEAGVEGLFKVKGKGRDEGMGRMLASEKVDKVSRLDVEKGIMNFWNEILGSVNFFSSQRHKMI